MGTNKGFDLKGSRSFGFPLKTKHFLLLLIDILHLSKTRAVIAEKFSEPDVFGFSQTFFWQLEPWSPE
jgi:hypothetical protein